MNLTRALLFVVVLLVILLFVGSSAAFAAGRPQERSAARAPEAIGVSPVEDLMREHGVLARILLIYEEILRRLDADEAISPDALSQSTEIVQKFVQDYHEKLEENYIFPRFRKADRLVDLVSTLLKQHEAGRRVVADIALHEKLATPEDRIEAARSIRLFIRMYRPHKSREDTILFPAFHSIVSPKEYDTLGDQFEDKEHELFGPEGFEGVVAKIEGVEKSLGIYELSKFTPGR